ncbi:MAG TPA: hypothetical protein VGQ62_18820 [Chloroflexota bacterium]|jgi:hypothetical protein|nr:hypothetical protein [Chloroflexota bacterium]
MKISFSAARTGSLVWIGGGLIGLVIVGAAAFIGFQSWTTAPGSIVTNALPTTAGIIEERWGVRFTQIGVTADGGLVDVRYQVLDADKAQVLTSDEEHLPVLLDEGSGKVINSAALMPNHNLQAGRTYFVLYRNTDGAITPGNQVSIVLGGQRLEHLVAW